MHDGAEARAIGIVIAGHAPLASALCASARSIVGDAACGGLCFVEVDSSADAGEVFGRLSELIAAADDGRGVLLLADLFGGSAANIAIAYLGEHQLEVVTGVSLPMLLEALAHRVNESSPASLARRVAAAGHDSVVVAGALLAGRPAKGRGHEASV